MGEQIDGLINLCKQFSAGCLFLIYLINNPKHYLNINTYRIALQQQDIYPMPILQQQIRQK